MKKYLSVFSIFIIIFMFNDLDIKAFSKNTNYWDVLESMEGITHPTEGNKTLEYVIKNIYHTTTENHDNVVLMFPKDIVDDIKLIDIYAVDDSWSHINPKYEKRYYANWAYPSRDLDDNEYLSKNYITGVQLTSNSNYIIKINLKNGSNTDSAFIRIVVKNLVNPLLTSTPLESGNETSNSVISVDLYDDNFNPNNNNENNNADEEKLPTFSQVEELKALIEQLKQELQNANNKLQQLENVLNELKPIASNIQQSVSSIDDKLTNTNNKLDTINSSVQSVENQLIPSNQKPIEKFDKNVEDLYSTDFIDNEVITNDEIYYQEKELIDLEVPNIPVMDIEEWEGFSIEEEIEKDEVKNKDEVMEMDNFKMDQTLPQQKFEMDKPLEMQELEIQQFEMDTFEQTNFIERDKPMIWGENP